jgi:methionyl-tRNA formyltransferase
VTLPLPHRPRRLVYLGTPHIAVAPLAALVANGYEVALVVTRTDARRGRGSEVSPSPVKAAAQALGIPVSHAVDDVLSVGAEMGVVVAFGRLIRPHVLATLPMVNLHFSLLPRWRGAAPVERALLAGDATTGVCLMDVAEELDAGDVFGRVEVPITPHDTLDTLRTTLVEAGSELLLEQLRDGFGVPEPQQGEVTYAQKVKPEDLHLDLTGPAARAPGVVAVGGAWTTLPGKRLKIWEVAPGDPALAPAAPGSLRRGEGLHGPQVAVGDGWLQLVQVQPEGKARLAAADWWNGVQPGPDDRLGS